MRTRLILSVAAVLFAAGVAGAAPNLPARSSAQDGVTVQVTPRTLSGNIWEFELALNTHSRALSEDPAKAAVLISDGGAPQPALAWQGDPPGGHHRKGVLQFRPVSPMPHAIELRFARPGESAPRSFRWQLLK